MHPLDQQFAHAMSLANSGQIDAAIALLTELTRQGHPDAIFTLGDCYWRGAGLLQDLSRGRELFRVASAAGHPMAVRAYTNLLASGIGGRRDWPEALRRLDPEARGDRLRAAMLDVIRRMNLDANGDPVSLPLGEKLSEQPHVRLYRGAFTPSECDFLMLLAEPTYERSLVIMDGRDVPDPIRTSDGSTFHWLIEDPATHAINRRIAALSGTAVEQGEPLHVLRYRPGQQYHAHHDWLPPPNRRVMTMLIYLNDDYEGGETAFPKAGLKVRGRKGDALFFVSALPNGDLDPMSEHAGLPVENGVKYLASRWIREGRHIPTPS
jgi:prolyl 4-hydroxylase